MRKKMLIFLVIVVALPLTAFSARGEGECSVDLGWRTNFDRYEFHYRRGDSLTAPLNCSLVMAEIIFDLTDLENAEKGRKALMKKINARMRFKDRKRVTASLELAFYLQKAWERRFLRTYIHMRFDEIERGKLFAYAGVGFVSLPLLGGVVARNPLMAGSYFQKFAKLSPPLHLPVGAGAFLLSSDSFAKGGETAYREIPRPPADDLDFINHHPHFDVGEAKVDEFVHESLGLGVGAGTTFLLYKWLKPRMGSFVTLGTGLVAGLAVEHIVDSSIDGFHQRKLRRKLNLAVKALEETREGVGQRERLDRVSTFIGDLQSWAAYGYRDVLTIFQEYEGKQAKAVEELGELEEQISKRVQSGLEAKDLKGRWLRLQGEIKKNDEKLAEAIINSGDGQAMAAVDKMENAEVETTVRAGDYPRDYTASLLLGGKYLKGFDFDLYDHFASRLEAQAEHGKLLIDVAVGKGGDGS